MRGVVLTPTTPILQYCHRYTFCSSSSSSSSSFLPRSNFEKKLNSFTVTSRPLRISSFMASTPSSQTKPFSVLFVCLGNICRSPAAEGVFRGIVSEKGMGHKFMIDSAGTIDYHQGNQADQRMRAAAKRRGIEITSISRPIRPSDFIEFDLIVAMDKQNRADILEAYDRWKNKESLPSDAHTKVKLMCSYSGKFKVTEVPDPYYGGPQGFEQVLDILEDACESLFNNILADNSYISDS